MPDALRDMEQGCWVLLANRPVNSWNRGKKEEFKDRTVFDVSEYTKVKGEDDEKGQQKIGERVSD